MDYIIKKASSFTEEEQTNRGIAGIPQDWPVEKYPYVDIVPDGFEQISEEDLDLLIYNNQASYDAWLQALRPIVNPISNVQPVIIQDGTGKSVNQLDTDNALIIRLKAAQAGWTYHLTAPEFTTSTVASLYHKNAAGTDLNECVVKYYDANDVELTTQGSCDTDCVKTVFYFEPTWNYEIIGGTLKTVSTVSENVRCWVIAVPDVPAIYGGSKVMVQGVNLKFIDPNNGIEADGRATKFMTYNATYHTNKIQLIIKHPAGHKEDLMMAFEVYRV